jgi:hypothetical protein
MSSDANNINLKMTTMGGMQFWNDYRWSLGWRLQKNAITKHWRILDDHNVRQTWGSETHCRDEWNRIVSPHIFEPKPCYIILLHGLFRTSRSMGSLATTLESQGLGQTISPEYASTRASVAEHSQSVRELLEALPSDSEFTFSAHSMGNIVLRHAFAHWQRKGDPRQVLSRCKGMVMIGPPNQGATIAKRLSKIKLFEWITGRGGMELGPAWKEIEPDLTIPPFPIVAGTINNSITDIHPLVDGRSDLVVSLEEAKLEGASKIMEVQLVHSFLMDNPGVQEFTVDFLKSCIKGKV